MVLTQRDLDDTLAKSLADQTTTIKALLDDSISAIRSEIIDTLNHENKKLHDKISLLESRNDALETRIDILESKMESNLQYQRNSCIIISGIPNEIEHKNLEGTVLNIFNKVCLHCINNRDIIACHRLSIKNDSVIVKFVNKKDAVAILNSKLAIKEFDTTTIAPSCKKLYVNEHLTPYMGQLAYKCRVLKRENKIYQTKVENGVVKVLTNRDGSFRWFNITKNSDIDSFSEDNVTINSVNNGDI